MRAVQRALGWDRRMLQRYSIQHRRVSVCQIAQSMNNGQQAEQLKAELVVSTESDNATSVGVESKSDQPAASKNRTLPYIHNQLL